MLIASIYIMEKQCLLNWNRDVRTKLIWKTNRSGDPRCQYTYVLRNAEYLNKSWFTINLYIITVYVNNYKSLSSQNKHKIRLLNINSFNDFYKMWDKDKSRVTTSAVIDGYGSSSEYIYSMLVVSSHKYWTFIKWIFHVNHNVNGE